MGRFKYRSTAFVPERAILVGVDLGHEQWPVKESHNELSRGAETDGANVVMRITQRLGAPVPRTFIGPGKASALVGYATNLEAYIVILDAELSSSHQANLKPIVGGDTIVIDRTALIVDIFGQHPQTHEGR